MLVSKKEFNTVLEILSHQKILSLDTETTGLRPYHGDYLFSVIIAISSETAYYFNFNHYDMDPEFILGRGMLSQFNKILMDTQKTWFMHNALFDLAFLAKEGLEIRGNIHCTLTHARIEYNDHLKYSLDACASRIGLKKDKGVDEYIKTHKLYKKESVPGKKTAKKTPLYAELPAKVIVPYAETDAKITYQLGVHQQNIIKESHHGVPSLRNISECEKRLTPVLHSMEKVGLMVDKTYALQSAQGKEEECNLLSKEFERNTEKVGITKIKDFRKVFSGDAGSWKYTKKGNPSFDSIVLERFTNPLAKKVLAYRKAKSKLDFFNTFLYYVDSESRIHPHLNPAGTGTGRFSSSEPNFQNLEKELELNQDAIVRRAIVPSPGKVFLMFDYDQMEYRVMLNYAASVVGRVTPLISKVLEGLDVHEATAELAGVDRETAKTVNFATLYGSGVYRLAESLNCGVEKAKKIRMAIFRGAPEISGLIAQVQEMAKTRGFIYNWMGRRYYFNDPRFYYKAVNYLIQGSCADIVKKGMCEIHDYLKDKNSHMVLQIHDEIVIEADKEEAVEVQAQVKKIMESVYPYKYLPLTVGVAYSERSLADKIEGEYERGDQVSSKSSSPISKNANAHSSVSY